MMREVHLEVTLPLPDSTIWNYFSSIDTYPKYVPFLRKAYLEDDLTEGAVWYDVTQILWIPMKMKHVITAVEEKKKFAFDVLMPFHGTMHQVFQLESRKNETSVSGRITFHLGNKFFDMILGEVLQKRLLQMLQGTFETISHEVQKKTPPEKVH